MPGNMRISNGLLTLLAALLCVPIRPMRGETIGIKSMAYGDGSSMNGNSAPRLRVRTPGKYLVLTTTFCALIAGGCFHLWKGNVEARAVPPGIEYRADKDGDRVAYFCLLYTSPSPRDS